MTSVAIAQEAPAVKAPGNKPNMDSSLFLALAEQIVVSNFNSHRKPDRSPELTADGVNMIWFAKGLTSFKAIFTSPLARGLLWEITYSRTKNELYLDVYGKLNNTKISMEELGA